MSRIIVTDTRDGSIQYFEVSENAVLTIGRTEGNEIILNHSKVSRRHSQISQEEGYFKIKDLGSSNGTFINNVRIERDQEKVVFSEDKIRIADFILTIELEGMRTESVEPPASKSASSRMSVDLVEPPRIEPATTKRPTEKVEPVRDVSGDDLFDDERSVVQVKSRLSDQDLKKLEILFRLKQMIHERLLQYLDLRKFDFSKLKDAELRERTMKVIRDIFQELGDEMPPWASKKQIAKEILDEALGLGPLEDFLADPSITEIMVNSKDQVYIERLGKLEETTVRFSSDLAVQAIIERIVGPIGRRIDESSPMVDARLRDGSRVNAIIPPLAIKGPTITIRKFSKDPFTIPDLINFGTLTRDMAEFLRIAVLGRKNIVVSGGTGSGKTTLLNVLSSFIPDTERILTIENVTELQLKQEHWVALEARPSNLEGRGEISVRDLVINALRMRPDRIVVGECRGGEAIDMIQAMNTGHDGSLTTLHSNSPKDTLARMETMSLMAGLDLPSRAIREQITAALDVIVHTMRFSDGVRRVTHITEVSGTIDEEQRIPVEHIFEFHQEGIGPGGKVIGFHRATGHRPRFLEELSHKGLTVRPEMFLPI